MYLLLSAPKSISSQVVELKNVVKAEILCVLTCHQCSSSIKQTQNTFFYQSGGGEQWQGMYPPERPNFKSKYFDTFDKIKYLCVRLLGH
jgi:hypothetical protein